MVVAFIVNQQESSSLLNHLYDTYSRSTIGDGGRGLKGLNFFGSMRQTCPNRGLCRWRRFTQLEFATVTATPAKHDSLAYFLFASFMISNVLE